MPRTYGLQKKTECCELPVCKKNRVLRTSSLQKTEYCGLPVCEKNRVLRTSSLLKIQASSLPVKTNEYNPQNPSLHHIDYLVVPEKVHKTSVYRNDNEILVSWNCRDFLENA